MQIPDRKYHAPPQILAALVPWSLLDQAAGHQFLVCETLPEKLVHQLTSARGVADLESLDGLSVDLPVPQVVPGRSRPLQEPAVVLPGQFHGLTQALRPLDPRARRPVRLTHRDARALRQELHRFGEGPVFHQHDELEDVPAGAAPETLEDLLAVADVE